MLIQERYDQSILRCGEAINRPQGAGTRKFLYINYRCNFDSVMRYRR